jgi:hypothetical protein
MNKFIGYLIAIIGLIGLALTFDPIKKSLGISLPTAITPLTLTIVSVIIVIIGVALSLKTGSSGKEKEVPVMKGDDIVGYRVVKKK